MTIARTWNSFTAACGHEVAAGADYVVKRAGVFYCSPDCAAEDTTHEIVVRLRDEANLPALLAGRWACLVWLTENEDGTYGLHGGGIATSEDNAAGEAYLRVGMEIALTAHGPDAELEEQLPPIVSSEPSEEVANWMERIRIRLGKNGAPVE